MQDGTDTKVSVDDLFAHVQKAREDRAQDYPKEEDCFREMLKIRERLKDLGWREGTYSPRDGRLFLGVEFGCTSAAVQSYVLNGFFAHSGGDLWPSRPVMFRDLKPGELAEIQTRERKNVSKRD